jgi:16S rRNA (cytosine967-C5)-methyltransferase
MTTIAPSTARAEAIALLVAVLQEKRTLDEAASSLPLRGDGADARFVMMLVLTVLRHLGQLDALLAGMLDRPLPAKALSAQQALRIGAAQLLLLGTPPYAAVHETVEVVKQGRDAPLAGLVNAVLQRIAREKPGLPEPLQNIPSWIRRRWKRWYGVAEAARMAQLAAERPPLDLHLPEPLMLEEGARLDALIWRLPPEHAPVQQIAGFSEGTFFVQDIAASYPARLLGDVRGKRVLDLGAAPGGKTAQLARAGAQVTALDRSAARLATLKENLARLELSAEIVNADLLAWQPHDRYDAILLDAPCSATGTWRKHPEVLQLVSLADVQELAALQRQMLARAWSWLKPGGRIIYCVCSLEREEGEDNAYAFARDHPDAVLIPAADVPPACISKEGYLRTLPHHEAAGGMDGFFAACFQKAT